MSEAVLDSAAVLALLLAEPGAAIVAASLPGALISTVNVAEIITKLCERGMPAIEAQAAIETIGVEIIDFDREQARLAGDLRKSTRAAGLSLGDRACLALARLKNLPAVTADRSWSALPGFNIVLIR